MQNQNQQIYSSIFFPILGITTLVLSVGLACAAETTTPDRLAMQATQTQAALSPPNGDAETVQEATEATGTEDSLECRTISDGQTFWNLVTEGFGFSGNVMYEVASYNGWSPNEVTEVVVGDTFCVTVEYYAHQIGKSIDSILGDNVGGAIGGGSDSDLQQAQPTTQPTHVSTEVIEEESSSVPEITRIDRLGYEAIPIKARPFYYNPIRKEKNCNKDCRFTGIGIRILADDYETEVGDYWFSNKTNEGGAACPNNLHRKKAFVEIFVEDGNGRRENITLYCIDGGGQIFQENGTIYRFDILFNDGLKSWHTTFNPPKTGGGITISQNGYMDEEGKDIYYDAILYIPTDT